MRPAELTTVFSFVLLVVFRYANGQTTDCAEIIRTAMGEYNTCVNNVYQILFSLSYTEAGPYYVQHRCASVNLNYCRDQAENRIGGCLDYNRRQSMEFTFNTMEAGYRYWCSDYAQNLYEFYHRRGPDCYFKHQTTFRQCEAEYPITNTAINEYTLEYCRILDYVLNCLQQVYERCLPRENPSLTRNFYSAMWRATPCPFSEPMPLTSKTIGNAIAGMWILTFSCLLSICVTIRIFGK